VRAFVPGPPAQSAHLRGTQAHPRAFRDVALSTSAALPPHACNPPVPCRPVVLQPAQGGAARLRGRLSMARSKGTHRSLDIALSFTAEDELGHVVAQEPGQIFTLAVSGGGGGGAAAGPRAAA
jgi:hypothetical protein